MPAGNRQPGLEQGRPGSRLGSVPHRAPTPLTAPERQPGRQLLWRFPPERDHLPLPALTRSPGEAPTGGRTRPLPSQPGRGRRGGRGGFHGEPRRSPPPQLGSAITAAAQRPASGPARAAAPRRRPAADKNIPPGTCRRDGSGGMGPAGPGPVPPAERRGVPTGEPTLPLRSPVDCRTWGKRRAEASYRELGAAGARAAGASSRGRPGPQRGAAS